MQRSATSSVLGPPKRSTGAAQAKAGCGSGLGFQVLGFKVLAFRV